MSWQPFLQRLKAKGQTLPPERLHYLAYQRGYWDFQFFAEYFFSHYCKEAFSPMHRAFCASEADPGKRGRREAIAAPRGNAKTTFKLKIKAIHAIVYGYESYILILGHAAPDATEKVTQILEELENNPRLLQVFGSLAPLRGQGQWGKKAFITQNGVKVVGRSKGQAIRGTSHGAERPTLIICDDVESPDEVLSPEQRLKTRNWFFKDVSKCGQVNGTTNITVIGTCLHPDSLLSELLRSPGYEASKYQAIISYATRQDLWEQWQTLYTNLSNPNRHAEAQAFYQDHEAAMLEGTEVLWPEGEPYEYLMRLRVDEGVASFQSEKQNDPFDPERQLFDLSRIQRIRASFEAEQFQAIHYLDGSNKIIPRYQLKVIAFHDPALGKKAGQSSEPDFAAIVVVAKDLDGYLYCLEAYIKRDPLSQQIENAYQLHAKWGLEALYFEDNGFQSQIKNLYKEQNNLRPHEFIRVKGETNTENKYKRISTLEPTIAYGWLLFSETLNPQLLDQLRQFPTGYDDGPDALQGAVSKLQHRTDKIRNQETPESLYKAPWF